MQEVCEKERKMCAIQLYLIFVVIFFSRKKTDFSFFTWIFVILFLFCYSFFYSFIILFHSIAFTMHTHIHTHHSSICILHREQDVFDWKFFFMQPLACINALLRLFKHNKCISICVFIGKRRRKWNI